MNNTRRKINISYLVIVIVLIFGCNEVQAQDASFSQNYASPLYLSPSFTGLTDGSRLAINYRDQWPSIPNTYKTMAFSFDHYFPDFNSGLGFLFYRDDQGGGLLINQNVGVLYAYEIFVSRDVMIRPGIQFKFAQSYIDASKANLSTSYDTNGNLVSGGGLSVDEDQLNKFDAAASVMIYSNFYWAGISVDHLVKSDQSFTDIETNTGIKFTAFGGYKWIYSEGKRGAPSQSVSFALNYRQQADFSQMDIGAYWNYSPLELGLWYRGLPGKNMEEYRNTDAVIAILGIHAGNYRFGYSYDLTISDLAGNTGGTHEFSIMYSIPSSHKQRINRNAIPCSQQGYTGTNSSSRSKYRRRSRRIF